jgi:CPA2 family monovalent cation:H+ antiporter-2
MLQQTWTKDLLIFLVAAGVIVPLFGRLRIGVVPGFLLAGILLGPNGLGLLSAAAPFVDAITFADPERVAPFAELGVIFLLFLIGLDFSVERLWAMRRYVFGLGGAQFLVSAAAIAAAIVAVGFEIRTALVAGMALALSSTAIVTQILIERRRLALPVGRTTLSVLIFQDLMVVPIVIAVGLLAGAQVTTSGAVLRALLFALVAISSIILAGRFLVRPLLRLAVLRGTRDLVVAIALLIAFGASVVTSAVGLSAALGAFLAGILLSASEYRHQLEIDVEPFKGLLLGLFFMTVGMSFDVRAVWGTPFAFATALISLLLVKVLVLLVVGRFFRLESGVRTEAAFLLAGVGEFAFVALTLASQQGVIPPSTFAFLISLSTLAMLVTPFLSAVGGRIGRKRSRDRASKELGVDEDVVDFADHVIIGGFGRVGRTVGRLLDEERIPYVGLDMNPDLVSDARAAGHAVFLGDASRFEILERLGGHRAVAFVVTTNDPSATEEMVRAIHLAWPNTTVHARALDREHAARLEEIGVSHVVLETLEASLQLGAQVLVRLGIPDQAVDDRIEYLRREMSKRS